MLTTMRIARRWILWLTVLAIGAIVPGWAFAAGRILTPQDSISIKVVNQPDMDTTTRVETDGTISFPYVGRIRAAGLSEDQLAHTIERQLAARQIVTEPHVLVEITTFGTQASVQGQVGVPGVYTLDRPTNLTQLLSRAGGLRDAGLGGTVTVRRGATIRKFDSKDVQAGRGPGADFRIANNDEVFVDLAPFFYRCGYSHSCVLSRSSKLSRSAADWRSWGRNGGSASSACQATAKPTRSQLHLTIKWKQAIRSL
jgi:polysaccharide biosynthesis/export protein